MIMKEKLETIFEALKELDMRPTPPNVSIMNGVYSILREIYKELEESEHGRAETDPEGQDSH